MRIRCSGRRSRWWATGRDELWNSCALDHNQPLAYADGDRLGTTLGAELCQDLAHVELRRVLRDLQLRGNRLVRLTVGEHAQHLQLAWRKGWDPLRTTSGVDARRPVEQRCCVRRPHGDQTARRRTHCCRQVRERRVTLEQRDASRQERRQSALPLRCIAKDYERYGGRVVV